jgi:GrpB-like predicted nucleotidyltransferase (UPF0157 family)
MGQSVIMRTIEVVDYDPAWPALFEQLRARLWTAVEQCAISVEHIGSTSVPGLAAKPLVDITVIVAEEDQVPIAIERLAALGYVHQGDLGVEGREAFQSPRGLPAHNLYVCQRNSLGLENHLAVRQYLRTHADAARSYGDLKKRLAGQFRHDIDGYVAGKTDATIEILRGSGFPADKLEAIARANRKC